MAMMGWLGDDGDGDGDGGVADGDESKFCCYELT